MNDDKYRLDDDLSRFEHDLKTLTPKQPAIVAPYRPTLSSLDEESAAELDAFTSRSEFSRQSLLNNPVWLKTVTASWATGLAAGVLISVIWNNLSKQENSVAASSLAASDFSDSSTQASPGLGAAQDAGSTSQDRQRLGYIPRGYGGLVGNDYTLYRSFDDEILSPLMASNMVHWNADFWRPAKRLTKAQTEISDINEQKDVPLKNLDGALNASPKSLPPSQGQRQWLKSLVESDDLISI